ncbi:MAG: ABC transporter permease [Chloroflexi bacterium]|nr:MAG: ABC transporter permease [Chloroflexota bacterium]
MIARTLEYALSHQGEIAAALWQHLELSFSALGIAILICVPLGILTSHVRGVSSGISNTVNTLRVIPSLAVLFLIIPFFGLTFWAAVFALTLLALPPVLINTDAAFRTIDPFLMEAAVGMGMTPGQRLRRVEIPLALPTILSGIRTAGVEVIASATLAAFIGTGGLGIFITRGLALYDTAILLTGAIPIAALTLTFEGTLEGIEHFMRKGR